MRKSSGKATLENYFEWLSDYKTVLTKIVSIPKSTLPRADKVEIFAAFVSTIWTQWEILSEDLLIDCLNRDSSQYAEFLDIRLPGHPSRDLCQVMLNGFGYFDVKSVDQLKKIGTNVLTKQYNPFSAITSVQKKKIEEFRKIRNYLAHYSRTSERAVEEMLRTTYGFQRFQQPGIFLSTIVSQPTKTRLHTYIENFESTGQTFVSFLGINNIQPNTKPQFAAKRDKHVYEAIAA